MDKIFASELLSTKETLFKRILSFNGLNIPPSELLAFKDGPLSTLVLKPEILRRIQREGSFFFDFAKFEDRLCLLTESEISRLQKLLGAVIFADKILKTVKACDLLEIKKILGEDIYNFATGRAQFYMSPNLKKHLTYNIEFSAAIILPNASKSLGFIASKISDPLKERFPFMSTNETLDEPLYANLLHSVLNILKQEMEATCLELSF